jgi:hypothetical protein
VSISSAQLKPTIAKRSNLRRSRLSKTVRIGVRFRFTALHAPASGDQRLVPASCRSRPTEFRIPRFSWNFLGVVNQPNNLRYISAKTLVSTPREKRQKLVSAGANHHAIQEYSRRPAPRRDGDRRRSRLSHTVSSSLILWQLQHALQTIGSPRLDLFQSRSTISGLSRSTSLMPTDSQPKRTFS